MYTLRPVHRSRQCVAAARARVSGTRYLMLTYVGALLVSHYSTTLAVHSSAFDIPRITQAAELKIKETARRYNIEK